MAEQFKAPTIAKYYPKRDDRFTYREFKKLFPDERITREMFDSFGHYKIDRGYDLYKCHTKEMAILYFIGNCELMTDAELRSLVFNRASISETCNIKVPNPAYEIRRRGGSV